ncbi:hypothetical protein CAAN1_01S00364 [[Candida] anglica]|uniref:Uncharacterized protein n=1 Tax=[Candida] anglica TaxID=148631 RepID=A0ABP0ENH4_9ASCO
MSLFKTLQNSPATISIFHNKKLPASGTLYRILEKADNKLNASTQQFQVDLMTDKMPTFDQFQFLVNSCTADEQGRSVLLDAYPFMSEKKSSKDRSKVTVQPPVGVQGTNWKTFTEGEYAIVHDAFEHLLAESKSDNPDHDPSEVFRAPLVVDWDQCLVAGDVTSLEHLLAKYQGSK